MEITFDRVSKKFGRNEVIKDISFHIKSNTIVGLKGINGSGKTMIMRLIAGLIYPTHGKVLIILKLRENTEVFQKETYISPSSVSMGRCSKPSPNPSLF